MSNRNTLFVAFLIAFVSMKAQTDVTDTYLTNPSFETDGSTHVGKTKTAPTGWSVTDSGNIAKYETHDSSTVTDNNFGTSAAAAGSYYYYLRMAWNTGETTLSQTLSSLPAGTYTLSAKVKTMYANSATSTYALSAGGQTSSNVTFTQGAANGYTSLEWSDVSVTFTLNSTNDVTIALNITWKSGGSQLGVDNFTLTKLAGTAELKNLSFESDDINDLTAVNNSADGLRGYSITNPAEWTVSGTSVTSLIVTTDCYTDNGFGKVTTIPDGTQAYYLRQGWATGSTSITQTVELPAGLYRFSVDQRTAYANGAASTLNMRIGSESKAIPFESGSSGYFTSSAWTTSYIEFELTETTTLVAGFTIDWLSGGSCVMLDNVKLEEIDAFTPEGTEDDIASPTEGIITSDFVPETTMMNDLLQMLADFSPYMVNDFNSVDDTYGYFNGESSGQSNEAGVRTNADLSMICAFLVKYAQPAGIALPNNISYSTLQTMALKSLMWALGTHKANKLRQTTDNTYWGSTGTTDSKWESNLWAMSVAYSAFFQWSNLTSAQKDYVYNLLKAECDYEINRSIPTQYENGDTKAEENGWDVNVLAATLGLYPTDALASQWYERMRSFAINSYSHYVDGIDQTVIDPDTSNKTVADLYIGPNLYPDYTLQNHSLFHTSYQNVVMQELGESALALKLFQGDTETWKSNALMHNNQVVMDSVLNWLALTDGELAMPNGNDWSLFLYDQITSYSTMACFLRDPNALMLENLAYKAIKARQKTTTDGSWLLRPDVGARRMGVEAHRVMMTYLMHLTNSTADLTPTSWEDFRAQHSEARIIESQNIVRAFTPDRFTTFSWSSGLSSYTGYIAANSVDKNKIIVPYRANNTGNLLGWYTVSGKGTNATPVRAGVYNLKGDGYTMNGELNTNDATLNNRFVIYSTPGNAVMYLDYVQGLTSGNISGEYGGLTAISVDEMTKTSRTLYYGDTHKQLDGSSFTSFTTDWVNIDNAVGFVSRSDKKMAFGDKANNNSIMTAKFYPSYSDTSRTFSNGSVVDRRNITYYSNVTAEVTAQMEEELQVLTDAVPTGWNGAIAADPDGTNYLLLANFTGTNATAPLSDITCKLGAPIFEVETTVTNSKSSATFSAMENNSVANVLKMFVTGNGITCQQEKDNPTGSYLTASSNTSIVLKAIDDDGNVLTKSTSLTANETVHAYMENGEIVIEVKDIPYTKGETDYTGYIINPNFDNNLTTGWSQTGSTVAVSYNEVERWNANFDFYQTIYNLPAGKYILSCQGFYRYGSISNASSTHKNGTEQLRAELYTKLGEHSAADAGITYLQSIIDEAGKLGNYGADAGNGYGYIPNTMSQTAVYFGAGLYDQSLEVEVGDEGVLTIGVRNPNTLEYDWTIFDNFRLTRIIEGEKYDVNLDGECDIYDVITIALHLVGNTPEDFDADAADINKSGDITLADVTALVNMLN